MDDYINLQKLRFRQLVQQYLQHSAFNVAKKNICSLHDRDIPLLSEKLGSLYIKKRIKWGEESWRLAGERIKHVRSLMKKFESIEKESGLLLIKPVLLWSRSINSLQRAVKASRHPKVTSRLLLHVPVPSLAPSQAPFGFHRRHPSTKDMEKLKSRYKETTEDLNFHTDVPFISHLGSFQRLWRPEALSQLSFIPDGERHINTPKLLELDFTTMQIPQQHPCFRSQQQALMKGNREHVRKLRSYVTITNNPLSLKTLQNKITADQKIYRPFETPMPPTDLKNISTNSEPATPRPSPEEMFHSGKDLNIGSSYDLPSRSPQWLHHI
ncbi:uncharacterized protein LOC122793065 isoform X2 [Protopterus annectens]|uniref:uncharacterized protein LOC122793065 isoform X2 n=1 Tax=Protopterus annectens TaxID=7888 RepID=UPI001CF95D9B|nr:uncharacterized protein LOC122793065 isoform X2 [Protopterus annectens]